MCWRNSSPTKRDRLTLRCAACTRAHAAVSSSSVMVTFFMSLLFRAVRVILHWISAFRSTAGNRQERDSAAYCALRSCSDNDTALQCAFANAGAEHGPGDMGVVV